MRRRAFISLLGGAAATWPLAARAQQPAMPVVGFLSSRLPATGAPLIAVISQGLKESGFTDGQNVAVDYRWAEGQATGARGRVREPACRRDRPRRDAQPTMLSDLGWTQFGLQPEPS